MDIKRCDTIADAKGGTILEVREGHEGRFVVYLTENDEPLLYASFSTMELAEAHGVQLASQRGHSVLHIVNRRLA